MTDSSGASPRAIGSARDRAILAAVQLAVLAPFVDKAVHLDDAFFLAIARHIQSAPLDPFGFDYNWAGTPAPVWQEMKNPPAVFYWQALLLRIGGEEGRWLHAGFWLFPLCASQATYELARRVTRAPLYPALLLVVCPAYWVSATSLMIDVPLIAAMTLALLCLVIAHERAPTATGAGVGWGLAAGIAASLAVLAKYFGVVTLPLLAAYVWFGGARRPHTAADTRPGRLGLASGLAVGLPLVAFAGWWLASGGHFLQASGYRADERADALFWLATHGLSAATFTAGLLGFPVALLAGSLLRSEERGIGSIALAFGIGAGLLTAWLAPHAGWPNYALAGALAASSAVFAVACLGRLPLDALGRTLWLWLAGALVFAVLLNWTLNARTVLLFATPGVLLFGGKTEGRRGLRAAALAAAAGLGGLAVAADFELAEFGRSEAARAGREHPHERLRFAGHWGFQYYMEAAGYEHVDLARPELAPGDIVIAPVMHQVANGGIAQLAPLRREVSLRPRRLPIALMDAQAGAGLHGSFLGPLPFAWSTGPLERVEVLRW